MAFNIVTATIGCTLIGIGTGSIATAIGVSMLVLMVKEDWDK